MTADPHQFSVRDAVHREQMRSNDVEPGARSQECGHHQRRGQDSSVEALSPRKAAGEAEAQEGAGSAVPQVCVAVVWMRTQTGACTRLTCRAC